MLSPVENHQVCCAYELDAKLSSNKLMICVCVCVISTAAEDEAARPAGAERRPQVAAGCDLAGNRRQQEQLCGLQQR